MGFESNNSRSNTFKSRGGNQTDGESYLDHVPESEQESEFVRVEEDNQSMGSSVMQRGRSDTQGTDTEMIRGRADTQMSRETDTEIFRGRSGTEMSFQSDTEMTRDRTGTEMIRGRSGTEMGRADDGDDEVERLSRGREDDEGTEMGFGADTNSEFTDLVRKIDDGDGFSERGSSYHVKGGQFLNSVNQSKAQREESDSIYQKGGKDFTEEDDSIVERKSLG